MNMHRFCRSPAFVHELRFLKRFLDISLHIYNNSYATYITYKSKRKESHMPPKPKITKDMILTTVLKITQQAGFEAVSARSIAEQLQCSTRPIFTCYENMAELKAEFLDFAFEYYSRYVTEYGKSQTIPPICCSLSLILSLPKKKRLSFRSSSSATWIWIWQRLTTFTENSATKKKPENFRG